MWDDEPPERGPRRAFRTPTPTPAINADGFMVNPMVNANRNHGNRQRQRRGRREWTQPDMIPDRARVAAQSLYYNDDDDDDEPQFAPGDWKGQREHRIAAALQRVNKNYVSDVRNIPLPGNPEFTEYNSNAREERRQRERSNRIQVSPRSVHGNPQTDWHRQQRAREQRAAERVQQEYVDELRMINIPTGQLLQDNVSPQVEIDLDEKRQQLADQKRVEKAERKRQRKLAREEKARKREEKAALDAAIAEAASREAAREAREAIMEAAREKNLREQRERHMAWSEPKPKQTVMPYHHLPESPSPALMTDLVSRSFGTSPTPPEPEPYSLAPQPPNKYSAPEGASTFAPHAPAAPRDSDLDSSYSKRKRNIRAFVSKPTVAAQPDSDIPVGYIDPYQGAPYKAKSPTVIDITLVETDGVKIDVLDTELYPSAVNAIAKVPSTFNYADSQVAPEIHPESPVDYKAMYGMDLDDSDFRPSTTARANFNIASSQSTMSSSVPMPLIPRQSSQPLRSWNCDAAKRGLGFKSKLRREAEEAAAKEVAETLAAKAPVDIARVLTPDVRKKWRKATFGLGRK